MYESGFQPRFVPMIHRLLTSLILLSVPLIASPVYIGTSSRDKGIYLADFDPGTGVLSEPVLAAEYQNPGFLVQHPTKPVLYACGAPKQAFADGSSSVAAFSIGAENRLKFLAEASAGGKGACHVSVDATGKTLAVANYGAGSFSTIKLDENGLPQEPGSVVKHSGSGPNKPRQDGPHAHGVYFNKANTRLYVPDLGLDQVFVYPFNQATLEVGGALPSLVTAPGAGPRHLAFSADERHAYVINELNGTVLVAGHDVASGKLTAQAEVSTLPAGYTEKNTNAEIEVHPNGGFVYASNRGHDSISVYKRDADSGALTFIQRAPCGGKSPRHFKIDPSGKWLLCAHQDSNTISVLSLDPMTGMLGKPGNTVASPNPICLLFAR